MTKKLNIGTWGLIRSIRLIRIIRLILNCSVSRNISYNPGSDQIDRESRAAIADKRQRHAGQNK